MDDFTVTDAEGLLEFIHSLPWGLSDSNQNYWDMSEDMLESIKDEIDDNHVNIGSVMSILFDYPSNKNTQMYRWFFASYLLDKELETVIS